MKQFHMNQSYRKSIGFIGEDIAEYYLKKHGFLVVARNCKISRVEIDIIAFLEGVHYLVEVKCGTHETETVDHNLNSSKVRRLNIARTKLLANKYTLYNTIMANIIVNCRKIAKVYVNRNVGRDNIMFHVREARDAPMDKTLLHDSVDVKEIRLLGIVVQLSFKPGVLRQGNYILEKVTSALFSKVTVCTFYLDDL